MTDLLKDFSHAARSLSRARGFTAVALATLALGIGANTAIFSLVRGVLLRELPYGDPSTLVELAGLNRESGELGAVSPGNFAEWSRAGSLESAAAYTDESANLTGFGPPRLLTGTETMGSIFDVLEVPPALGRTYSAEEDRPGGEPVIVLSHATWRELYGEADPVGTSLTLDGESHAVIGVMPPDFRFPDAATAFWMPGHYPPGLRANRTEVFLDAIARLAPGADLGAASSELRTIASRLREEHPQANESVDAAVLPLKAAMTAEVATLLKVLMGAVGAVLLIACVNLANLMLARAGGREREIAVRKALGASRLRVARLVLAEGLVLAIVGGALGLWLGSLALDGLLAIFPLDLPRSDEIRLDRGVLLFTASLAIGAGLLFALLPALRVARQAPALRLQDRTGAGWPRRSLVVAEVVLAMVVLSGAGLLLRSFMNLRAVEPGYAPEGLVAMRISLPGDASLERREAFFRELDARLEAVPGVTAASYATALPAVDGGPGAWLNLKDRPAPAGEPPMVEHRAIAPDFSAVAGIRLIRGRLPDPASSRERSPEVLIDEQVARRFWPDGDPLGTELTLGPEGNWIQPARIVGVVAAVQDERLGGGTPGLVYVPHAVAPWWGTMAVVVRTDRPLGSLVPELRAQVAALDPLLPVAEIARVQDLVSGSISTERSTTLLLSTMAALALMLAAVGLFGVLSYTVARRTRELGIRAALGADPSRVRRMVLGQGTALVAMGIVPGALIGLVLSTTAERMLFGVTAGDPVVYAAAGLLLFLTGMAASWEPARRATRVDPAGSLRAE